MLNPLNRSSRAREIFLLVLTLANFSFSSPTYAIDLDKNSDVNITKAQIPEVLAVVNGNPDRGEVAKAILALKHQRFSDVAQAVLTRLGRELSKAPEKIENTIVTACLDTLKEIKGKSVLEELKRYREVFTNKTGKTQWAKTTIVTFNRAIKEIERRGGALDLSGTLDVAAVSTQRVVEQPRKEIEATLFKTQLMRLQGNLGEQVTQILNRTTDILTDDVREELAKNGKVNPIIGRENEVTEVKNILARIKGRNPILLGQAGLGKTSIVQQLAQEIVLKKEKRGVEKFIANAEILVTSPGALSKFAMSDKPAAQQAAVEDFFNAILKVEKALNERAINPVEIIVFIDEVHNLSAPQMEAVKTFMDSKSKAIRIIGASTPEEFYMAVRNNDALRRRWAPVGVGELSAEDTLLVLKSTWIPEIQEKYHVSISDDVAREAIRWAKSVYPDKRNPDAPFTLLQAIAVKAFDDSDGQPTTITVKQMREYAQKLSPWPVDRHDINSVDKYLTSIRELVEKSVIDQPDIVNSALMALGNMIRSGKHSSVLNVGPSGVGKTHLPEVLSKVVFNDTHGQHYFRVDGTTLGNGGFDLNYLIGSVTGTSDASRSLGTLVDWLNDPARGKFGGILFIDEADKIHPDIWKKMMEWIDRGEITAGNGRVYKLNNHVIMLSSNRGSSFLFPQNKKFSREEINKRIGAMPQDERRKLLYQPLSSNDTNMIAPEVANRIDFIGVAGPATVESGEKVAHLREQALKLELSEHTKVAVDFSDSTLAHIALTRTTPNEGYRDINREIKTVYTWAERAIAHQTQLNPGDRIKIELIADPVQPKYVATLGKYRAELEAPRAEAAHPLDDPQFRARMSVLSESLKSRVFGQDHMIDSVVRVVLDQVSTSSRIEPISVFLTGPTSTGKTELGKTLFKAVTGREAPEDIVIPLSDIAKAEDLKSIFGGQGVSSLLERLILSNPHGGVIIWDEFSNMGGSNQSMKNALMKQWYNMTREGVFVSGATGRSYRLDKFIFVFTGNDTAKRYQGLHTDEERMNVYDELRQPKLLHKALLDEGVPEPFLARVYAIAAKPLLVGDVKRVAQKFIDRKKASFVRGVDFTFASGFEEKFATTFYSHDTGAMSIEKAIQMSIGSIMGAAATKVGPREILSFNFDLEVNSKSKVSARVTAQIKTKSGETFALDSDLSDFATHEHVYSDEIIEKSFVRAAEIVLNSPRTTGEVILSANLNGLKIQNVSLPDYNKEKAEEAKRISRQSKTAIVELLHGQESLNSFESHRILKANWPLVQHLANMLKSGATIDKAAIYSTIANRSSISEPSYDEYLRALHITPINALEGVPESAFEAHVNSCESLLLN